MAYALRITDEDGYDVVVHVSNYEDDTVYIDRTPGLPASEWRKAEHLIEWVRKNKPNWKIMSGEFDPKVVLPWLSTML